MPHTKYPPASMWREMLKALNKQEEADRLENLNGLPVFIMDDTEVPRRGHIVVRFVFGSVTVLHNGAFISDTEME